LSSSLRYRFNDFRDNTAHSTHKALNIGKSIVTEQFPSTMDLFWFVVEDNVVINPFDFVSVENINNSVSIGIVKDIQSVAIKELPFLLDTLSLVTDNNYGDMENPASSAGKLPAVLTVAKVAILANTGEGNLRDKKIDDNVSTSLNMPIKIGKTVKFATADQVSFALGIPEMKQPIPAGIIEMSNGIQVPVSLDITYIAGPDTTHVNVSGISGNQKTTYLLFLLQSSYQTLLKKLKEKVAAIIFNLKEDDLLHINRRPSFFTERQKSMFDILDMKLEPFKNVTYFLPRGSNGTPNSKLAFDKSTSTKIYSYEPQDIHDRLDLLFPDLSDPRYNLFSIIDYIHEAWPLSLTVKNIKSKKRKIKPKSVQNVRTWADLVKYDNYPDAIIPNKTSLLHFRSHLQKLKNSSIFVDKRIGSTYLGNEILNIKSGDVFVIDIAKISSVQEQSFIVGDVMKTVDQMFSSSDFTYSQKKSNLAAVKAEETKPKYLFIFIDEINRFAANTYSSLSDITNSVSESIMRTIVSGRSRGTILFSAQQFKSATDLRLHDYTGLHITAKLGLSELLKRPYADMIDDNTRTSITRLNRGEMVMVHPAFRHAIKILFPHAAVKKP
jgi:uncharacterized protein